MSTCMLRRCCIDDDIDTTVMLKMILSIFLWIVPVPPMDKVNSGQYCMRYKSLPELGVKHFHHGHTYQSLKTGAAVSNFQLANIF